LVAAVAHAPVVQPRRNSPDGFLLMWRTIAAQFLDANAQPAVVSRLCPRAIPRHM
jgi:hypothetical protein